MFSSFQGMDVQVIAINHPTPIENIGKKVKHYLFVFPKTSTQEQLMRVEGVEGISVFFPGYTRKGLVRIL